MVKGKKVTVPKLDGSGEEETITIEPFEAPVQTSNNAWTSPARFASKGNGTQCELEKFICKVSLQEQELSQHTCFVLAREGIEPAVSMSSENSFTNESGDDTQENRIPAVSVQSLTPFEVHRRTGFQDLKCLLSYQAILFGGDIDEMTKTVSKQVDMA